MSRVLLLGAGFSRNWGGWLAAEVFEYLLGCPEISNDPYLRSLLWSHQPVDGFEGALEQVQSDFVRDPATRGRLNALQGAVTRMFEDMNNAFFGINDFEFQRHIQWMVKPFLTKFDAIFTLNQDLLLEHHYKDNHDMALTTQGRLNGIQLPGMRRIPHGEALYGNSWARSTWVPLQDAEYRIEPRAQPYFKLHGSSSWRNADGGPLLVMGGQKPREIRLHSVLSRYAHEFDEHLRRGNVKLMIIGYGFRDAHINAVITNGVENHGLRMFIVSPQGSDLARSLNQTRERGQIIVGTQLEEIFERSLIGASRRPLRDTFGGDTVEFNKVQRFFGD